MCKKGYPSQCSTTKRNRLLAKSAAAGRRGYRIFPRNNKFVGTNFRSANFLISTIHLTCIHGLGLIFLSALNWQHLRLCFVEAGSWSERRLLHIRVSLWRSFNIVSVFTHYTFGQTDSEDSSCDASRRINLYRLCHSSTDFIASPPLFPAKLTRTLPILNLI